MISEQCYYYFVDNSRIVFEGYELPDILDELLIYEIEGGEDSHGCYLRFACSTTQYYDRKLEFSIYKNHLSTPYGERNDKE